MSERETERERESTALLFFYLFVFHHYCSSICTFVFSRKRSTYYRYINVQWLLYFFLNKHCTCFCLFVSYFLIKHTTCRIASRCDGQITHAIILTQSMSWLQKEKSGMENTHWRVTMFDIHFDDTCECIVLDMSESGDGRDRADRLADEAAVTNDSRVGRSEVFRSLRHCRRNAKVISSQHKRVNHVCMANMSWG